jgi:hypothetical protein
MYLAKHHIATDTECICLDGNFALPFPDATFDCVFSTDALQYIGAKLGLARDFARVMQSDGIAVLAHLHNRSSAVTAGIALTAQGYDGLFAGLERRMYPEESIVDDYVGTGALMLDRRWSMDELTRAVGGLSLIAAPRADAFRNRTGLIETAVDAMRTPSLNPIYRTVQQTGDCAEIERTIDAPYAVERTAQGHTALPRRLSIPRTVLNTRDLLELRASDRASFIDLVRRFVVLELPENYV